MTMLAGFETCLKWFTGKARTNAMECGEILAQSQADGQWPKGASRKVHAALNKQNVAIKFGRANEKAITGICDDRQHYYAAEVSGFDVYMALTYGQVVHAPKVAELVEQLTPLAIDDAERELLATARQWAADWAPVAELMALLDSRRVRPTVVMGTLSRTVVASLYKTLGMALSTIAMPEIKYHWEERTILVGGKPVTVQVAVGEVIWPEGTQHNRSRFAMGTAHNEQCHACGHAIKNAYNWIPLYAVTPSGPMSLWVGRDCAKKLFACDVSGEAEFPQRAGKAD